MPLLKLPEMEILSRDDRGPGVMKGKARFVVGQRQTQVYRHTSPSSLCSSPHLIHIVHSLFCTRTHLEEGGTVEETFRHRSSCTTVSFPHPSPTRHPRRPVHHARFPPFVAIATHGVGLISHERQPPRRVILFERSHEWRSNRSCKYARRPVAPYAPIHRYARSVQPVVPCADGWSVARESAAYQRQLDYRQADG